MSSVSSAGLPAAPDAWARSLRSGGAPKVSASSVATASPRSGGSVMRVAPSSSSESNSSSAPFSCWLLDRVRIQASGYRASSRGSIRSASSVAGLAHCRSSRLTRTGAAAARRSRLACSCAIRPCSESDWSGW